MADQVRVVNRDGAGKLWAVRNAPDADPTALFPMESAALAEAVRQLKELPDGGRLMVYSDGGTLASSQSVAGSAEWPPPVFEVMDRVDSEGKKIDKGLEALLVVSALVGTSALSAFVSPELKSAASGGWVAVFLATLSWCLGCGLAVIVMRRSGLAGWPLVTAVSLAFAGALLIATTLGTGVLDVPFGKHYTGTPFDFVIGFAAAALQTYGPVGALLGGGVGVWLGFRFSEVVPDKFWA